MALTGLNPSGFTSPPQPGLQLSSTGTLASTKAFKKAKRSSLWRSVRHPIRVAIMALAAVALTWSLVGMSVAMCAGIAAGLGVMVGEVIGRGRLKLAVVLGGALGGALLFWALSRLFTSAEFLADIVGPGAALSTSIIVRFTGLIFWPVLALRALAARKPSVVAIEVIAVAAAAAVLFAAHRGGIISRPFWLSDWAWRAGFDPAHVLLAIGGMTVVILTALMVAETGRRITWVSVLALPLLALGVMTFLDVSGLPKPKPDTELGLTENSEKDTAPTGMTSATATVSARQDPSAAPSGETSARPLPSAVPSGAASSEEPDSKPPEQPKPDEEDDDAEDGPDSKNAPLAVVLLGDDYSPPGQSYYFRQEILSEYNGSRLVSVRRSGIDLDGLVDFPTTKTRVVEPPPPEHRQKVRADVALLVAHTQPFALEGAVSFEPRRNPNPQRFVRAYHFESLAQRIDYRGLLGRKMGDPAWADDVRQHYLVPSTDPRFAELAQDIVAELPEEKRADPFMQAVAVKRWMDKSLIYSTKERHAGVPDPTADFLFGNRIGYCVHFAHAAVFMWRSLGIPSRSSTGYMVSEDTREGSSLLIRGGDAHAWPELYIEGVGWVVLDIAAERNLDEQVPPPDKDLQRKLSELARQKPPGAERPEDLADAPLALPSIWLVLFCLALSTLVVLYAIKIWRRLVFSFAGPKAMTRVGYRLALDLLAEVGLTREYGEPREHFARRIERQVPSFAVLTRMHLDSRWAVSDVPQEQRPEFSRQKWKEALGRLRKERKTVTKTSRRVASWLNPASFVWAR